MQNHLATFDLTFRLPDGRILFKSLTVALPRIKTGLIGPNGVGKSTLLQILAGRQTAFEGRVTGPPRVSYLAQSVSYPINATVAEAIEVGDQLNAAARIQAGEGTFQDLAILDGCWDLGARVDKAFAALDITHISLCKPVSTLSGGELMRVRLAGLLLSEPDFLLLDEPTNHLDYDAREFVYALARDWKAGLVVVSHDRKLLSLMDQIMDMGPNGLKTFGGNYDFYRTQQDIERAAALDDLERARFQLKKARATAREAAERQARRSSAGKKHAARTGISKMDRGNLKRAAENSSGDLKDRHNCKIEEAQAALAAARQQLPVQARTKMDLEEAGVPRRKRLVELTDVNFRYSDSNRMLWDEPIALQIFGAERISLQGPNGSGKTTLLDLIRSKKKPICGAVNVGTRRIGVLDQEVSFINDALTILQNLKRAGPARPEHELRIIAGRFLFEGDAVHRMASALSGGERLRIGLAAILSEDQAPELLILDEPTNNLDLPGILAVTEAVQRFRSALVVVSHDRTFLDEIGITRTISLSTAGLRDADSIHVSAQ